MLDTLKNSEGTTRTDLLEFRIGPSILDRFGPQQSAIVSPVSGLRMRSLGFDSHRPLQNKR